MTDEPNFEANVLGEVFLQQLHDMRQKGGIRSAAMPKPVPPSHEILNAFKRSENVTAGSDIVFHIWHPDPR